MASLSPGGEPRHGGLDGYPGRAGVGVGQHAADEHGHLPPVHLLVGREPEGRRPRGHPQFVDLADGGTGPEVDRGQVGEVVVVGLDPVDVGTAGAGGGGAEEPGKPQCHVAAGDRGARVEGGGRGSVHDPELDQLVDGILGGGQHVEVGEPLIGDFRQLDPGRAGRLGQEQGHLPAGDRLEGRKCTPGWSPG